MLKDGFYSAAPLGSPRVKKWLSVQIRHEIEHCFSKSEKLGTPVNMKNRNIVDYLALCHTVWTPRVRIPYSTHGGWNRRLSEGSFLPPARAGRNSAGPPQSCTLLWTSAWYLHPCQTCSLGSLSWQSLVRFCTTTWIKCSALYKTSQNGQFFIKSSILVLCSEHPHGICTLVKHVGTVHRVDNSWYIFVLRLE